MANKLANALLTIIAEKGLNDNLGKAAEAIGVSYPSLRAVLAGKGKPNKATVSKYRAFLGVEEADFANLLADVGGRGRGKAKTEPVEKPKGRRGRKPKAESAPEDATTASIPSAINEETEEIRAPRDDAETRPVRNDGVGHEVARALAAIDALRRDELALRVHTASPGLRALIAKLV